MTRSIFRGFSPLEQVQHPVRDLPADPDRPRSVRDQAVLKRILAGKCDYVANALFESVDAEKRIFDDAPPILRRDSSWYHPAMAGLDIRRPNHARGTDALTKVQEQALFLQFNFCRHKVAQLLRQAGECPIASPAAEQILAWYHEAEDHRDQIIQANLALVLAMVKATRVTAVEFSDLVSEGNMALLRAADKFDVARGFKFSTYACQAILKSFSRAGVKLSRYRRCFSTDFDSRLEPSDFTEKKHETHNSECVDEIHHILKENLAELTDIEGEVLHHRFGVGLMNAERSEARPLTLDEVGKIIGVTKERVRQIQNKALAKIRVVLMNEAA